MERKDGKLIDWRLIGKENNYPNHDYSERNVDDYIKDNVEDEKNWKVYCRYCGKEFNSKSGGMFNTDQHNNATHFICEECFEDFKKEFHWYHHSDMRMVNGVLHDWRIDGVWLDYIKNVKVEKTIPIEYAKTLEHPEMWHEHCEFCAGKAMQHNTDTWYTFTDHLGQLLWICDKCFTDFHELFKMELKNNDKN